MKIDQSKLKHVVRKDNGKITAQCPACAADGADAKGDHLVVYKDGKFGCVVHEGDKAHNKIILKLAGSRDRGDGGSGCRLSVKPLQVKESEVLMKVGRLGRVKPSPEEGSGEPTSSNPTAADSRPDAEDAAPSNRRGRFIVPSLSPQITNEEIREFLDSPVLAA